MAEQQSGSTTVKTAVQSTTVNVSGNTNGGPSPAETAGAVESIELGPKVSLTIANDALNVLGETTACPGSETPDN